MHNSDTTIGENLRYFMHKYKIVMIDSMIFQRYVTELIIKFNLLDLLHSWMTSV